VQSYTFNEDLKFMRYSEYRTVFVFPMDEANTNLLAVLDKPNAYIVKLSGSIDGPRQVKVSRLD